MKKYRLIREYPNSPKLNTIFNYWTDGISEQIYNKESTPSFIPLKIVNQYSEFWEEIVEYPVEYPVGTQVYSSLTNITYIKREDGWYKPTEKKTPFTDKMISSNKKHLKVLDQSEKVIEKEYEILSFKQNTLVEDLWTFFQGKGWCRNHKSNAETVPYTEEEILNNQLYSIHSVRRLLDNEIFTLGDKCHMGGNGYRCPILKIELTYNEEKGHLENFRNKYTIKVTLGTGYNNSDPWGPFELNSSLTHSEQPLFKTEDGVDIFEGDKYWVIIINLNHLTNPWIAKSHICDWNNPKIPPLGTIQFSTKEVAEEYILMNKPCLSINNIAEVYVTANKKDSNRDSGYTSYCEKLRELVKQKL